MQSGLFPSLGLRSLVAGLSMMFATVVEAAHAPLDPSGVWITEDGRARIKIEHCRTDPRQICGYVVWMKYAKDENGRLYLDRHNPNISDRTRIVLGHQMLLGLTANAEARFSGDIYNADDGKTYEVTLWRETISRLKLKGCMFALFCGTQTWALASDVLPGELTMPPNSPGGPRADSMWRPVIQSRATAR